MSQLDQKWPDFTRATWIESEGYQTKRRGTVSCLQSFGQLTVRIELLLTPLRHPWCHGLLQETRKKISKPREQTHTTICTHSHTPDFAIGFLVTCVGVCKTVNKLRASFVILAACAPCRVLFDCVCIVAILCSWFGCGMQGIHKQQYFWRSVTKRSCDTVPCYREYSMVWNTYSTGTNNPLMFQAMYQFSFILPFNTGNFSTLVCAIHYACVRSMYVSLRNMCWYSCPCSDVTLCSVLQSHSLVCNYPKRLS